MKKFYDRLLEVLARIFFGLPIASVIFVGATVLGVLLCLLYTLAIFTLTGGVPVLSADQDLSLPWISFVGVDIRFGRFGQLLGAAFFIFWGVGYCLSSKTTKK